MPAVEHVGFPDCLKLGDEHVVGVLATGVGQACQRR
jgi:hypothetical protein